MPGTNNPKRRTTAWLTVFFAVTLAWLPSATVSAQSSSDAFRIDPAWTRYEAALLDSVLLYQALKPVHSDLQKTHDALKIETQALRRENIMLRLQAQVERETYQRSLQLAEKRRKRQRWFDRATGFAVGLIF